MGGYTLFFIWTKSKIILCMQKTGEGAAKYEECFKLIWLKHVGLNVSDDMSKDTGMPWKTATGNGLKPEISKYPNVCYDDWDGVGLGGGMIGKNWTLVQKTRTEQKEMEKNRSDGLNKTITLSSQTTGFRSSLVVQWPIIHKPQKVALKVKWEGLYQVLWLANRAAEVQGKDKWEHMSHLEIGDRNGSTFAEKSIFDDDVLWPEAFPVYLLYVIWDVPVKERILTPVLDCTWHLTDIWHFCWTTPDTCLWSAENPWDTGLSTYLHWLRPQNHILL